MINFLLVPFHTNFLESEDYGIVVVFYSLVAMLMVIFSYRMETAFFRFGTDKGQRESAFSTALISILSSTVLFVGVLLLFSDFITINWLNYAKNMSVVVSMFALILGLDVISEIPFARLRLENRAIRFAGIKLINILVNVGFNLFFLALCPWILAQGEGTLGYSLVVNYYQVDQLVFYIVLSNLLASTSTILLLLPDLLKTNWQFDTALWRKMFLYSAPLILAGLAGIANEVLDRQLLKYLLPASEANAQIGIYGACYKLAMLMSLFTQAFRYAAEPFFFAQAKNKDSELLYAEIAKYFAIVGIFAFLFINFYLDYFQYFVGREYREGLVVVPILLLANLFLGLYYNLSVWYKLTDKTTWGAYIMTLGVLITIVLNVWLIPSMGYLGSAWATLACYATVTAVSWFYGNKYFPVPYDWKRIFGYLSLALGLYFTSLYLENIGAEGLQKTLLNTCLLILFTGVLYFAERSSFKKFFLA